MPRAPLFTRALLRLYQDARSDPGFQDVDADLRLLQNKDLDLSIRLGAILAFDALLIGTAIQPMVASPGAPLALDAAQQPLQTLLTLVAIALLALSGLVTVIAITIGEEFSGDGLEARPDLLIQRLYAAYCTSIDKQRSLLTHSIRLTIVGLLLTALAFAIILTEKLLN
ncbi:hypothetical protein [Sandaracinobacteroides saxicola]|uniref:Uncharacterized protein n=1 Tax=Sandaracinobacteroides saxicola TaxID=2759707 RepID=A0A7G5IE84_9SPHN|nr:hypothetical protein [Sandaracinobacteroides saxicola]QMW21676.1 hypothetical protein H3309_09620 [Sandaracinobacteroides saxicola]